MKAKHFIAWFLTIALVVSIVPLQVNAAAGITADVKPTFSTAEEIALIKKIFSDDFSGVEITNLHLNYCGNKNYQIGSFYGASGEGKADILEFDSGVALSTGDLYKGITHNPNVGNVSRAFQQQDVIDGETIYDPASIEFDIVTTKPDTITVKYAFASEEYMEYSMSNYNDRFAILINGENCAKVPGTDEQIAINSVNQSINSEFFRPNSNYVSGANAITSLGLNIPMDGLTKTFVAEKRLKVGSNHVKIVIGDYGDHSYDSVMFIKANSFKLEEYVPGNLSIEKTDTSVIVKRLDDAGNPVTSATGGFTLVYKDLDGTSSEVAYTIADGESQVEIPFGNEGEDLPNTVPFGTKTASITKPKMGAQINPLKKSVELAIAPPLLSKYGNEADNLLVKGIAGASVALYKNDTLVENATLGANGEHNFISQTVGGYYAKQSSNGLTSAKSNIIKIVKPPIISGAVGAFDEDVRVMDPADQTAYDLTSLNVTAHKANGTVIAQGANFTVDNDVDKKVPGLYTIKWTAKDSGFTTVKTKIVKVKPTAPILFKKNYKDSYIQIMGLPGAIASVYHDGQLFGLVGLDANGVGKLIDPPNGNYQVLQVYNGVASDKVGSVDINRTFNAPVITVKQDPNYAYQQDPVSGLLGYNTTFGAFYLETGATANDIEDDNDDADMNGGYNTKLNQAIKIENPMFNSDGVAINVTNPALDQNGDPKAANTTKFYPFVGKYVIKYRVTDSDDMVGEASKLFRVHPPVPTVSVPSDNINSEIDVDALASASVFLYNATGAAIKIVNGAAQVIGDADRYDENKHERLKMPLSSDKDAVLHDVLAGLPNGNYRLLQRLYGLNSGLSGIVTVKRSDQYPLIVLKGAITEVIEQGTTFVDPGYTVSDLEDDSDPNDGRETTVTLSGTVDSSNVGRTTIVYKATDGDGNQSEVKRVVLVKPAKPQVIIGDYIDGVFSANQNGNDIKIIGQPGATVQIVKGKNGQGALQKVVLLDDDGEAIIENLEVDINGLSHAAFQTINEIQSGKYYFTISKTNTVPVLSLNQDSAIIDVEKGKSVSLAVDTAVAQDIEDGDISDDIKIYQALNAAGKVTGNGVTELTLAADQTGQVGHIDFYYHIKDSDGNSAMKVRQVAVNPLPPILQEDGETVVVSDLEANASAELYMQNVAGTFELIGTKKGDANGKAVFGELSPGVYYAKQFVNTFVSAPSEQIYYENPAYLHGKIVDYNDQPIAGVTFNITDFGKALNEKSDQNGAFTFGVESLAMAFDVGFKLDNINYTIKATSSEDENVVVNKANVVGQLTLNGTALSDDHIVMKLYRRAADGKFLPSVLAKLTYQDDSSYRARQLMPNQTYRIKVFYKADEDNLYPLTAFSFDVKQAGVIKVVNHDINYGIVTDQNGQPLSDVKLTVYPPDRNLKPDLVAGPVALHDTTLLLNNNQNGALTDQNGQFGYMVYDDVEYVVVAQKEGYQDDFKLLHSVDGQLLAPSFTLLPEDESASTNTQTGNQQTGGTSNSQADTSDQNQQTTAVVVASNNQVGNQQSLLEVVRDNSSGLTDQNSAAEQSVNNDGHITYHLGENVSAVKVTEPPKQGTLFSNPLNGQVIYVPTLDANGDDSFTISATNNNTDVSTTQKVHIDDDSAASEADQNALLLSLTSEVRSGFVGDQFELFAAYKNNLGRNIEGANLVVELPDGFTVEGDYQVVDNHLIIPISGLKAGEVGKQRLLLNSNGQAADISVIKGLIQENGSDQVAVQSLSKYRLKMYQTDKLYHVEPYIKGFPDGNFYQDRPVTRAEIAAMLTRVLQDDIHQVVANDMTFSDIADDAWYAGYIAEATSKGLFHGFTDGSFRPDKPISRAELAKVIANYIQVDRSEMGVIEHHFSDIAGHWAQCAINAMGRNGISNGYSDNTFKPDEPLSRAEAVKMINNMLYRQVVENVDETFKDLAKENWAFGHIESAYRGYHFKKDGNGVYQINALK